MCSYKAAFKQPLVGWFSLSILLWKIGDKRRRGGEFHVYCLINRFMFQALKLSYFLSLKHFLKGSQLAKKKIIYQFLENLILFCRKTYRKEHLLTNIILKTYIFKVCRLYGNFVKINILDNNLPRQRTSKSFGRYVKHVNAIDNHAP